MKKTAILIILVHLCILGFGQNYLVSTTFTLKEPRLLVFDDDNLTLEDSLKKAFNLQKFVISLDTIKISGMVSYLEGQDKIYIFQVKPQQKMLIFKTAANSSIFEKIDLKNDLTWAIEKIKFENIVSLFYNSDNIKEEWTELISSAKATYGGINLSKFRNIVENNKEKYIEFMY